MGNIISRTVAESTKALAAAYNALRADLLDNHDHDGTKGTNVNHGNLVYESGYALVNTHEEVDDHIAATNGVHGHNANAYVAGIAPSQMSFVSWWETDLTPFGEALSSWETVTWDLPVTMADANYGLVSITAHNTGLTGDIHAVVCYVDSRTTTQMTVRIAPDDEHDSSHRLSGFQVALLVTIVGRVAP